MLCQPNSGDGTTLLRRGHSGEDRGLGAVASRRGRAIKPVYPGGRGGRADKSGIGRADQGSKEGLSLRTWYGRDGSGVVIATRIR